MVCEDGGEEDVASLGWLESWVIQIYFKGIVAEGL